MSKLRTKPWCNHYSGMYQKETCDAGVRFDSLPHYGTQQFMGNCPCFGPCGGCDKAEYPTAEQLAENRRKREEHFANIGKARAAIVQHCGGPWKRGIPGQSGKIDCPACGAEKALQFSRSGYNGHIHAKCCTDGCVAWME